MDDGKRTAQHELMLYLEVPIVVFLPVGTLPHLLIILELFLYVDASELDS